MKIRNGFVSNSSTSSFICDFCGDVTADRDLSMEDAGMLKCENGHLFCNAHEDVPDLYSGNILFWQAFKKTMQKKLATCDNKYLCEEIETCIQIITDCLASGDRVANKLDEAFDGDYYYMLNEDIGMPEEYCPVCKRQKEMEKDPKYKEYKELYEHFKKVLPTGCVKGPNHSW